MEHVSEETKKISILSQFIDQKRYNRLICDSFGKIDNPTDLQKMEYLNSIRGGICIFCKKPWVEKKMHNQAADYKYFIPACQCLEQKNLEEKYKRIAANLNELAHIPKKYQSCDFKGMDRNIDKRTLEAIIQSEKYLSEKKYNEYGLILYGDIGTGKTHVAVSVMKWISIREGLSCVFIHASNFISNVVNKKNYIQAILKKDIILLDDIDKANTNSKSNSKWVDEQFFSLINGISSNKKILIGTGNIGSIDDLRSIFNSAIVSRMVECCYFVPVKGDDYRLIKRGKAS